MSSRIYLPDDPRPVAPVPWRQVHGPKGQAAAAAAGQPDWQARMAQLEQQAQQRVREAHAAGVREGEATGRERASADLRPVLDRLGRAMDDLASLRARLRKEAESDMVKLALAIARKVLRRELAVDPEALHGVVLAAFEKLQAQEICRVRVHPSHVAQVTAALPQSLTGVPIEVVPDPGLQPGGVLFETSRGNLDVSVETQLKEIERGLIDRLEKNQ